jgi:hypothetical protein
MRDHAEVMRYQQKAHGSLGLQVLQQSQDLRLNGDVQRGGRLVRDQQIRLQRNGHGDHDALALPARKLVWVVVHPARRLRDADPLQQADGFCPCVLRLSSMDAKGFANLPASGVDRVERRKGVLENHGDVPAVDPAALLSGHAQQVSAAIGDFPGSDPARRTIDQPQYG